MIEGSSVNVITHGYLVITLLDYKVGKVYYQFIITYMCSLQVRIFIAWDPFNLPDIKAHRYSGNYTINTAKINLI